MSNTNIYARPAIWVYCPGDWSYYGGYAEEEDTKQKDIKKNTKKKNEQNLSVDYAGASLEFPGSLFEKSPSVFNDDLAKLGAMLNQAACNDEEEILQLFHKMKIEDSNIENFNYDGENAFSIAHRSIVLNGEEANLIFIVARGSRVCF